MISYLSYEKKQVIIGFPRTSGSGNSLLFNLLPIKIKTFTKNYLHFLKFLYNLYLENLSFDILATTKTEGNFSYDQNKK